MPRILAGTGYNQVILFDPNDKRKQKEVYGAASRQPVLHLSYYSPSDFAVYASAKTLTSVFKGQTSQIVKLRGKESIISADISRISDRIEYTLSNGAIYETEVTKVLRKHPKFEVVYKGDSHTAYVGSSQSTDQLKTMFFGKVVPQIIDKTHSIVSWKGKNVKHDELDLEVPINDVDGAFFKSNAFLSVLNGNNQLRIYDVRGTQKRPIEDIQLKMAPRSSMTKLTFGNDENVCYVGNSVGEIFQLDGRKNWLSSAKYKGITSSISDIQVGWGHLYASSMDCCVRIFDLEERSLLNKFYLNKPICSLYVDYADMEEEKPELKDYDEQEVDLQEEGVEEEEKQKLKVKHIRKRNKVGLKYVRPQQFDTPEEEQLKEEEDAVKKEEWYRELNPIDRRDFQQ